VSAGNADREPLPHALGRYRPRWEEPAPGAPEGSPRRMVARDTVLGKDVELARVAFGADRRIERDQAVESLRARTTVLAPALVAVHDAGDWDDDAFVLFEPVEAAVPIREAIATLEPPLLERLRWAVALADAALVLDRAELALSAEDWAATTADDYRVPRVPGLERPVPVPDDRLGERVGVFVELRRGMSLDLAELTAYLAELGVSREWWPERLWVLPALPRSSGGKVAKAELRELARTM